VAELVSRTVAVPGGYVTALGAIMIALGMVLPPWSVYSRTQSAEVRAEIAGGPLRPVMIQLPPMADGTTFAIAESEVSQMHFYRVFGWMPSHIADRNAASWQACPAPFNLETVRRQRF
jgi:hypothetical protein